MTALAGVLRTDAGAVSTAVARQDWLAALAAGTRSCGRLALVEERALLEARSSGASWSQLAAALGISGRDARRRWALAAARERAADAAARSAS